MPGDSPPNASGGRSNDSGGALVLLERVIERLDRIEARLNMIAPSAPASASATSADALPQILDRLERLERAVEPVGYLPAGIAVAVDTADKWIADAQAQGIDIDDRLRALGALVLELTRPENLEAARSLVTQLPNLAMLAEMTPATIATVGDTFDGLIAHAAEKGIDVDYMVRHLLRGLGTLVELIDSGAVADLVESGVLSHEVLFIIGRAAEALVAVDHSAYPSVGMLGALRAGGRREVKRSLGFAIEFASQFGRHLDPEAIAARKKSTAQLAAAKRSS